jgi:hypothetical protein
VGMTGRGGLSEASPQSVTRTPSTAGKLGRRRFTVSRSQEVGRGGAFILLVVGTVGLLLNEFFFHWGRQATLVFAVATAIGLVVLGVQYVRSRRAR